MRGIGHAFSRLPAARAMIAGVALLAGMSAQRAMAQTSNGMDDTALAVPRVSPRGLSGVALPQPLALSDAARLRRIFALQASGNIPAALRETEALDSAGPLINMMLGHVLAD